MSIARSSGPTSLQPDATTSTLIRAAAANHRAWFAAWASLGGDVRRIDGVRVVTAGSEITIPFPRIAAADADRVLDRVVSESKERRPNSLSVWAVTPTRPRDMGARLLARGFHWGWQPHWMAMDFRKLPAEGPKPPGVAIAVDDESDWDAEDLPYYNRSGTARFRELARKMPGRLIEVIARLEGQVVGRSVVFLSVGSLGVAGIYNVGVRAENRWLGIGRALMDASCRIARERGSCYALLNSAASEFYMKIGFDSLGWGQTWWMHRNVIGAPVPTSETAAFIAALARGDLAGVRSLDDAALKRILGEGCHQSAPSTQSDSSDLADPSDTIRDLDRSLPNGMTPIEVAACARRPGPVVEWLMSQGATLDLRQAWDMGWRDRLPGLVEQRPDLIGRRAGPWRATPLQDAAARGDAELVRALLALRPNLDIEDTEFHSTPLGWARHFGNAEIVRLIEAYQASRAG